jgi:lipoprotein-releasing system ATP-binding protein
MILTASNIHKKYITGKNQVLHVLRGVSINIQEEEIVAIVGPSGAGKSTLLHILGLLDSPDEGSLILDGEDPVALTEERRAAVRNKKIGFVFQFHHLLPEFTALENVMIPALIARENFSDAEKRAMQLLEMVKVDQRSSHKPGELSGGEQQRVAIARALMNNPRLVFADEPSGNLDSDNARALHDIVLSLRREQKQTFVIVTHNKEFAAMADRIITLRDGLIVPSGT